LLGLFIVWQLFFLTASNLIKLADQEREYLAEHPNPVVEQLAPGWSKKKGHIHDAEEVLTGVMNRWAQLTNQPQNWSLFGPNVAAHIPFVLVELRWEDDPVSVTTAGRLLAPLAAHEPLEALAFGGVAWANLLPPPDPVQLPSDNAPADPRRFFRMGKFRLRKYESYLSVYLSQRLDDPRAQAESWREKIEARVRREGETMHAYLNWRLREYRRQHPGQPWPVQVVLLEQLYRVPEPDRAPEPWMWQEVHVAKPFPVARWRPRVVPPTGCQPVEAYNPSSGRFEWVTR
jgi:hypothetical protein